MFPGFILKQFAPRPRALKLDRFPIRESEKGPEFFRDERGKGVEQKKDLPEADVLNRQAGSLFHLVCQSTFRVLHVPVAKIIPEKTVNASEHGIEFELFI